MQILNLQVQLNKQCTAYLCIHPHTPHGNSRTWEFVEDPSSILILQKFLSDIEYHRKSKPSNISNKLRLKFEQHSDGKRDKWTILAISLKSWQCEVLLHSISKVKPLKNVITIFFTKNSNVHMYFINCKQFLFATITPHTSERIFLLPKKPYGPIRFFNWIFAENGRVETS